MSGVDTFDDTDPTARKRTMAISTTQKRERALRTRKFLEQLLSRYPACFAGNVNDIRPLAIGIQKTLRADLAKDEDLADTPGWLIRQALALYTRAPAYLEATIRRRLRVNLDGSDAGEISDEAVQFASTRRDEQKQRQVERRKQNAQARRRKPARPAKPAAPSAEEIKQRKLEALAAKFNNS